MLDSAAQQRHGTAYLLIEQESDRVAILQANEHTPFFTKLRNSRGDR